MLANLIAIFLFATSISAQLYLSNDVMFDYPDEAPTNDVVFFDNYPEVVPEYRVFSYPQQSYSYSQQMWTGCGCAHAKTYGDYMKTRSRSRDQRYYSYYQMM